MTMMYREHSSEGFNLVTYTNDGVMDYFSVESTKLKTNTRESSPIIQSTICPNNFSYFKQNELILSNDEITALGLAKNTSAYLIPIKPARETVGIFILNGYRKFRNNYIEPELIKSVLSKMEKFESWIRIQSEEHVEHQYINTLFKIARQVDETEAHTAKHANNTAKVAKNIAEALGLSTHEINQIYVAGKLHDLGKAGIPENILTKADKLTSNEWEKMKQHPKLSAELLAPIKSYEPIIPLVLGHHEKFDGTGYPDHLKGENIPLGSRILAIADTYTTITDGRIYKDARSSTEACEEIEQCAGTQFDPEIVEVFLQNTNRGRRLI
jgi:HD-GYP domain-containing protein (c-di-GMP phosphodiesterase class II)